MEGDQMSILEHEISSLLENPSPSLLLFESAPRPSPSICNLIYNGGNNYSHQFIQLVEPNTTMSRSVSTFGSFNSSSSEKFRANGGVVKSVPTMQDIEFVNGLLADPYESLDSDISHDGMFKNEEINYVVSNNKRSKEKKSSTKSHWTQSEDSLLVELVKHRGHRSWGLIAKQLSGRKGKQCRERWQNHLCGDVKKGAWSDEEEWILVEAHKEIGNKWAKIAELIPGRTENSIKNHWHATIRKLINKRNNKAKHEEETKSLILQEYMETRNICSIADNMSPPPNMHNAVINNSCPPHDLHYN